MYVDSSISLMLGLGSVFKLGLNGVLTLDLISVFLFKSELCVVL